MWIAKNWRLLLEAGIFIGLLLLCWYMHGRGYDDCKADDKAALAAALISGQQQGINALDTEMLSSQLRNDHEGLVETVIGKSDEKTKNSPTPDILRSVNNELYGTN